MNPPQPRGFLDATSIKHARCKFFCTIATSVFAVRTVIISLRYYARLSIIISFPINDCDRNTQRSRSNKLSPSRSSPSWSSSCWKWQLPAASSLSPSLSSDSLDDFFPSAFHCVIIGEEPRNRVRTNVRHIPRRKDSKTLENREVAYKRALSGGGRDEMQELSSHERGWLPMTYVCKAISASHLRNYWNTARCARESLVRNKWRNMSGKVLVQDHPAMRGGGDAVAAVPRRFVIGDDNDLGSPARLLNACVIARMGH